MFLVHGVEVLGQCSDGDMVARSKVTAQFQDPLLPPDRSDCPGSVPLSMLMPDSLIEPSRALAMWGPLSEQQLLVGRAVSLGPEGPSTWPIAASQLHLLDG